MNKIDLARSLAERHEMPRSQANAIIDEVFEDITTSIVANDPVRIPGFGVFRVRDRAARVARNPATGEPVKVPAKRVFKFLPAKALKEAIAAKRGPGSARKKTAAPAAKRSAAKKSTAKKSTAKKTGAKKSAARKR